MKVTSIFKGMLLFAAFTYSTTTMAQVEKNVVFRAAQGEIKYDEPKEKAAPKGLLGGLIELAKTGLNNTVHHPEFVENVRTAIAGAIGTTRRISVVDPLILADAAENDPILVFDGTIGTVTTTSENEIVKDDKGKSHDNVRYMAVITATINVKDGHTGEILTTIPVNTNEYSWTWVESAEKALGNALTIVQKRITNHLNLFFPMYASIVEGDRVKKDKQKEVYIDLGELDGAFKGMTFAVYTLKTVAGREAKKEIGRLKVEEVMGDNISLCKVTRGGVQIKQCIDNGEELVITSTN